MHLCAQGKLVQSTKSCTVTFQVTRNSFALNARATFHGPIVMLTRDIVNIVLENTRDVLL